MIPPDRDDELDALLGALGTPAGSAPLTPADRILAMAVPPVVVPLPKPGIPRWVLGGSIAAATTFGFVGGAAAMYLVARAPEATEVAGVPPLGGRGTSASQGGASAGAAEVSVASVDLAAADVGAGVGAAAGGATGAAGAPVGADVFDGAPGAIAADQSVGGLARRDAVARNGAAAASGALSSTHAARPARRDDTVAAATRYERVAIRTVHEVPPLAAGVVDGPGEDAVALAEPRAPRQHLVGAPVSLGAFGRSEEDPFASIPFEDAPADERVAVRDEDHDATHVDTDRRARRGSKEVATKDRRSADRTTADVSRGTSPFALAFNLGGRGFEAPGERRATGLTTGADVRFDLARGAVRPVLEAGFDLGAGLFPAVGPLALVPHLGAELEVALGLVTPSIGWTVAVPVLPPHAEGRLALLTGPSLGVDIGRQDRPHFRARVDVEAATDKLSDGIVDANVAVSGGVEIPLGTW
jgi:hypothetical protein